MVWNHFLYVLLACSLTRNTLATWEGFSAGNRAYAAALAAGGEVVLAAGATHTPQLLMLSGIGPAQQLKQHGIEVVRP